MAWVLQLFEFVARRHVSKLLSPVQDGVRVGDLVDLAYLLTVLLVVLWLADLLFVLHRGHHDLVLSLGTGQLLLRHLTLRLVLAHVLGVVFVNTLKLVSRLHFKIL